MLGLLRFLAWGRKEPQNFLDLLIRAQHIQETDHSMAAAFRAGLAVGLKYPELAANLVPPGKEDNENEQRIRF